MICEKCGKEHDGSFGTGRFCSKSCANSRIKTQDIKDKISKTLKSKTIHKPHFCKICGRQILDSRKKHICNFTFCQEHNISQIKTLIKYFGFDETKLGTCKVENEFNRVRDMLYNLYWNEHMSSSEICKKFNYPNVGNITGKLFKYLNIESKTCKYSSKENYYQNRTPINTPIQYKQQWHTTWNNKEVYLHSSYELDYAKELDEKQIDYDVECLRIKYWDSLKNEFRCAIPDFYIPAENLIVEIKSCWTLDEQNMKDRKIAYINQGYNFKLICDFKELEI